MGGVIGGRYWLLMMDVRYMVGLAVGVVISSFRCTTLVVVRVEMTW